MSRTNISPTKSLVFGIAGWLDECCRSVGRQTVRAGNAVARKLDALLPLKDVQGRMETNACVE